MCGVFKRDQSYPVTLEFTYFFWVLLINLREGWEKRKEVPRVIHSILCWLEDISNILFWAIVVNLLIFFFLKCYPSQYEKYFCEVLVCTCLFLKYSRLYWVTFSPFGNNFNGTKEILQSPLHYNKVMFRYTILPLYQWQIYAKGKHWNLYSLRRLLVHQSKKKKQKSFCILF